MTTIVTADLHLADNPRDAYRFVFLEETLPALIKQNQATRLIIAGDLTEQKDAHRAGLVNRIVDGFAALAEVVDVYVLKGNHDYVAADVPFYRFLRHLDRVRWINKPLLMPLRGLGECLFLPHTSQWREEWKNINQHDWIFAHQTFDGADLGHGHRFEGQRHPFRKGDRVISGDVHTPQKLGPITYVGAPYSIDFGDSYTPRVLLLDGDKMRSVSVPGPQKRLIVVTNLDRLDRDDFDLREGDVVKVRVEVGSGDLDALGSSHIRKLVHDWAAEAGVNLYAVQVAAQEGTRAAKVTARDRARQSDEQLVRAYAKKMGKGRATVAAGLKIVEKAP